MFSWVILIHPAGQVNTSMDKELTNGKKTKKKVYPFFKEFIHINFCKPPK